MKNTKRLGAVLACIFLVAALFAGCSQNAGEKISVSVKITGPENVLLEETAAVAQENPTAKDAIIAACQEKKMAFTYEKTMFDNFDNIASTKTDGWLLYVNGKLSDVGADTAQIAEGDLVEFRYENYDQAFAQ